LIVTDFDQSIGRSPNQDPDRYEWRYWRAASVGRTSISLKAISVRGDNW
jgi:hypothetical protein